MSDWYERHGRRLWTGLAVVGVLSALVGLAAGRHTMAFVGACLAINEALAVRTWNLREQGAALPASTRVRAFAVGFVCTGVGVLAAVLVLVLTA